MKENLNPKFIICQWESLFLSMPFGVFSYSTDSKQAWLGHIAIGYHGGIPMETSQVDLKKTVNLPQTGFSMKANLAQLEPKLLAHWDETDLYERIREARKGQPTYILHDGPPYANGNIHLGHALNKLLKDFIVKMKTMQGFDSPYVPGWDCHGLPIEIKVDSQLGAKKAGDAGGPNPGRVPQIRRKVRGPATQGFHPAGRARAAGRTPISP